MATQAQKKSVFNDDFWWPDNYTSQDMREAHKHMNLTE